MPFVCGSLLDRSPDAFRISRRAFSCRFSVVAQPVTNSSSHGGPPTDRPEKAERAAAGQDEGADVQGGEHDPGLAAVPEDGAEAVHQLAGGAGEHQGAAVGHVHDDTADQVHVRGRHSGQPRTRDRVYRRRLLPEAGGQRRRGVLQAARQVPGRADGEHPADRHRETEVAERHQRGAGDEAAAAASSGREQMKTVPAVRR